MVVSCFAFLNWTRGVAQTAIYTSTVPAIPGVARGWTSPSSWTCVGACGSGWPNSSVDHAVVINHLITTSTSVQAFSIKIENAVNAQDAKLVISGIGNLTVGAGGMLLNGTSDNGGNTELAIIGSGDTFIGGNVMITQNKNSGQYTKFRLGGGALASSASVTINGNLTLVYNNSSVAVAESDNEINLGSNAGDDVNLTVNGSTSMTYSFENTVIDNNLSINVASNSSIDFNGDVTMTMVNGGTNGKIKITLFANARVSVAGKTELDFQDNHDGTDIMVEVNDVAQLLLGNLNLKSNNNTGSINNYVRTWGNSLVQIGGDIGFTYSGSGTTPSQENRIEANENSTVEIQGDVLDPIGGADPANTIGPLSGSFDYTAVGTTAKLSGGAPQIIPTNLRTGTTYRNIIIDNSSGVSLSAPTVAAGVVTLTNGILTSTTSNILTLTDVATTAGGSMTSYIDGPTKKTCVTGNCGDTFFNLGDDNLWAPLSITNINGENTLTTVTVEYNKYAYSQADTDGTFDHRSGFEHWLISTTGATPTTNLAFYWKDACASEIEDADPTIQTLFMGWYDGIDARWEKLASTIDGASDDCDPGGINEVGSITVTSVSSFGPFTFISQGAFDNPLPVELINFEVTKNEVDEVKLSWETATETENDFFVVHRAPDMINWVVTDTLAGHGTTNVRTRYYSVDQHPFVGNNYYRLSQHDFDGDFTYSPIRFVNVQDTYPKNYLKIYPNPVNPALSKLNLEFTARAEEPLLLHVIGVDGITKTNFLIENTSNPISIELGDLANGVYLLKVESNSGFFTRKFCVVQRP
jgi:hypothetical protein